ncbi:hypothetical protein MN116_003235 [Schistosoma mekongi]|uniref:Protein xylosyltransferase n=1 Tax=Schistosoma mekongi TaxID=38744 RepID=A0AAE1ZHD9_SCHME|nr:hypothetical protein MN116_003235 [Schistosoma mekongi]
MLSSHGLIMFIVRLPIILMRSLRIRVIFGSLLLTLLLTIYYSFNSYSQSNPTTNQLQTEYTTDIQRVCEYLFTNPIVNSNNVVIESIHSHLNSTHQHLSDFRKCQNFKLFYGHPVESSMQEKQFPLAFSLSIHENIEQASRLLRLIYRSHNLYCIHVDSKSPQAFYDEVMQLATCFGSNVMLVNRSESVNVQWGYYSLFEAFLLCADKLMKNTDYMWKYLLNVSGQEMPLRTNWELVAALKAINGSNVVEGVGPTENPSRWPKRNFTFPFTWNKGSFYVALKREFVHFYQTDEKANEILDAMKAEKHLVKHPDELYFSTLTYNPQLGAPGACNEFYVTNNSDPRKKYVARYVTWYHKECRSSRVSHGVCIIGINDLPFITSQVEFFANKFHHDFEPIAYDCTEYYIMRKCYLYTYDPMRLNSLAVDLITKAICCNTNEFCEANKICTNYGKQLNQSSYLIGKHFIDIKNFTQNQSFWIKINQINLLDIKKFNLMKKNYSLDEMNNEQYNNDKLQSDLQLYLENENITLNGKYIVYYNATNRILQTTSLHHINALDIICEIQCENNNTSTIHENKQNTTNNNNRIFIKYKRYQKCSYRNNTDLLSPNQYFDGCYSQSIVDNKFLCAYSCTKDEYCPRFYFNNSTNDCILTHYTASPIPYSYNKVNGEWECYSLMDNKE